MNLEPLCARYGRRIIDGNNLELDRQENVVTKALAVLSENGLYAMTVFLLALNDNNARQFGRRTVTAHLRELWKELGLIADNPAGEAEVLDAVREMCDDLGRLVLARKVTENALVFARYHAKAGIAGNDGGRA